MAFEFHPLGDQVLVERAKLPPNVTPEGVILPDSTLKQIPRARVLAIGEQVPLVIEGKETVGREIYLEDFEGSPVRLPGCEKLALVDWREVRAFLDEVREAEEPLIEMPS